jgi:hypothetical protein
VSDTEPAEGARERLGSDRVSQEELEVLLRVRDSLRSIRFGTVLVVVQDGRVLQIETAEKIRLR